MFRLEMTKLVDNPDFDPEMDDRVGFALCSFGSLGFCDHQGKLFTVFSASNYCGLTGEPAGGRPAKHREAQVVPKLTNRKPGNQGAVLILKKDSRDTWKSGYLKCRG